MGATLLAFALAAPLQIGAATSTPVGSTQTTMALCPNGPDGATNPGAAAPAGCVSGSSSTASITVCKDADVHAFVRSEIMMGGKRPAFAPLAGMVKVHLENDAYGYTENVQTFADSGAALLDMGSVPPGSYKASATLWAGSTTNPDGTTMNYPSSSTSMSLTVTDSPCGGETTTASSGPMKKGCGLGDDNHAHDPGDGKTCPTK